MKPTKTQVLKELRRELGMRVKLYPQWKLERKITKEEAAHRISTLEECIRLIELLQEPTNQVDLFSTSENLTP